jgi:hypothetical protein
MSIHRTCVIPRRHRLCGAGILRLVWLHVFEVYFDCLYRQRSCGNVPTHSVFKGMITVTILLLFNYVDRSWATSVEKFFVFCFESQQLYQSRSMHSCTGTDRTHRGCGRWFSYCYPFICIYSCLRHCWIASGLANRPYASTRLVPQLTYDLHRTSGLGKVSVSPL